MMTYGSVFFLDDSSLPSRLGKEVHLMLDTFRLVAISTEGSIEPAVHCTPSLFRSLDSSAGDQRSQTTTAFHCCEQAARKKGRMKF